jgi:hypothetical protein
MTVTHYPLERTASHLILQLNDLRINERLADLSDTSSFEQLVPELGQLAHDAKAQGQYFGIDRLVIVGLGGCVCPATPFARMRGGFDAGVSAAVHVLTQFFEDLSSFFQLEIFSITGYALSSDGELMEDQCSFIRHADALVYARLMFAFLGDRRIAFRAFESDQVLFHAARESYLWNYVFPIEDWVDSPIRSQIHLAAAPDHPAIQMMS